MIEKILKEFTIKFLKDNTDLFGLDKENGHPLIEGGVDKYIADYLENSEPTEIDDEQFEREFNSSLYHVDLHKFKDILNTNYEKGYDVFVNLCHRLVVHLLNMNFHCK